MSLELIESHASYGGTQRVYRHFSQVTGTDMTFAVYIPPGFEGKPRPVLWYLSGLTCTHANVMEKGEFRAHAAEHNLVVICPDTSPRGSHIPDIPSDWQIGMGAGFYVDATEDPWAANYRMYSYVTEELPRLAWENFAIDADRQGIFGHSMGGHGAIILALRHPERFKSCSAFAPIVNPMRAVSGRRAFTAYLGQDQANWRKYDSCALIEDGARFPEFLVDQGAADEFLNDSLHPRVFEKVCRDNGLRLNLRMQEGYDHSYYFVSTFMADHIRWHAERLKR